MEKRIINCEDCFFYNEGTCAYYNENVNPLDGCVFGVKELVEI